MRFGQPESDTSVVECIIWHCFCCVFEIVQHGGARLKRTVLCTKQRFMAQGTLPSLFRIKSAHYCASIVQLHPCISSMVNILWALGSPLGPARAGPAMGPTWPTRPSGHHACGNSPDACGNSPDACGKSPDACGDSPTPHGQTEFRFPSSARSQLSRHCKCGPLIQGPCRQVAAWM